jgi:hypothetical protein
MPGPPPRHDPSGNTGSSQALAARNGSEGHRDSCPHGHDNPPGDHRAQPIVLLARLTGDAPLPPHPPPTAPSRALRSAGDLEFSI